MKTSFSITIKGSYTSENTIANIIAVASEGAKVLDICTTLLPNFASDGSPLFAEPMFLFGSALCNTSTYCMLALWLSWLNYALRGEFPLLHRLLQDIFKYALFWLIFSLKTCFPIILFRFLETNVSWNQSFYVMNVPLAFIIFFAKVTTLFLKWKRISPPSCSCSKTLHCCAS